VQSKKARKKSTERAMLLRVLLAHSLRKKINKIIEGGYL
jgi:hypothetical protein